jgi:hypothetical protein
MKPIDEISYSEKLCNYCCQTIDETKPKKFGCSIKYSPSVSVYEYDEGCDYSQMATCIRALKHFRRYG